MPDATERKCLKCGELFMSLRPKSEHRICPKCDKGPRRGKTATGQGPKRRGQERRAE